MPDEISGMGKTNGNTSLICKKNFFMTFIVLDYTTVGDFNVIIISLS
jgi:hypothetical protein